MDWRVPITSSLVYILAATIRYCKSRPPAGPQGQRSDIDSQSAAHSRVFITTHNAILAVFSGYVFCATASLLWANLTNRPSHAGYCDVGAHSYQQGVGFLIWAYYISKYLELIDTAILLGKGRCSWTHIFHHAGSVLSMWALSSSHAYGAWIFILVNSCTHALVYSYFALATIGYQAPWKAFVTFMQFIHMIVGLPLAISYLLVPKCFVLEPHPNDQFAKLFNLDGYWSAVLATSLTIGFTVALVFLDSPRRNATMRFLRIRDKVQ